MTKNSTKMADKKTKDYVFVALMLLIPAIHFMIFWGVVNFNSILLAFQRLDRTTGEKYLTFKNFEALVELFETNELKDALVNTLITAGFQIIFLLPWGFFLTYFLLPKVFFAYFLFQKKVGQKFSSKYASAAAHQRPFASLTIASSAAKRGSVLPSSAKSASAVSGRSMCV